MSTLVEQLPHEVNAPSIDAEAIELVGVMGEFDTVDGVVAAAAAIRKAGYTRWDVHTPFPIHGIDSVMAIRPTVLPWIVLAGGLSGLAFGIWLQWFCNAHDYPIITSGKPLWSFPANIPIDFECTVLFSAITAVFAMLGLNRLPMLYNPLFKSERFRRVTDDRFFLVVDASDARFDEAKTVKLLNEQGALTVERIED